MPFILCLETSAEYCSVALQKDEEVLKAVTLDDKQAHASKLAPLIRTILEEVNIEANALNAVAISAGPGSYTGLRIGTSTAKGLCYALKIPLIAISTLELLAAAGRRFVKEQEALICATIDARRMEIYCQIFDNQLIAKSGVEALEVNTNSFAELLNHRPVFFVGSAAQKCSQVIKHDHAQFLEGIEPTAETMVALALRNFRNNTFENVIDFTPFYLKEFVAKTGKALL